MRFPTNVNDCKQLRNDLDSYSEQFQACLKSASDMDALRKLDMLYYNMAKVSNIMEILKSVHPDETLRNFAQEQLLEMGQVIKKCTKDPALYVLMKTVRNNNAEFKLDAEDTYYLKREMAQMEAEGAQLDTDKQQQLLELDAQLESIGQEFMANNQNKPVFLNLTQKQADASGLDLKRLGARTDKAGNSSILLSFPNYTYIMDSCESQLVRQECYLLQNSAAFDENNALMDQYLRLQTEKAYLLNYANSAEQQLATESVATPQRLEEFYETTYCNLLEKCGDEMELLKTTFNLDKLELWDVPYYINQYRCKYQNFDKAAFRKYFPTEYAMNQMIKIYENLFDLKFELEKNTSDMGLWHRDVKVYRVSRNGEVLGHILVDLFPRKGKFGHMCMMRVSSHNEACNDSAVALVIANLDKKYLTQDSIVTFFHEFGHAIHQILGHAKWASASGNACLTDYVEFPAQLLEEWIWDAEVLQFISKETIPQDELANFLSTRKTFLAQELQRQLILGFVAFKYFRDNLDSVDKRRAIWAELMEMCMPSVEYNVAVDMTTRFLHLCVYGCKYYSYLWSKCIAIEVFQKIRSENDTLIHAKAGQYMDLLTMGGGLEPIEQTEKYLGHALEFDAIADYVSDSVDTKSDTQILL